MNNLKIELEKQFHSHSDEKNKYLGVNVPRTKSKAYTMKRLLREIKHLNTSTDIHRWKDSIL